MLIGREKEIKELNELYHSEDAELIALYGRRRVGKTYLIDEVFRDRLHFRHAGLSPIDSEKESVKAHLMKDQLTHFFRSLTMQGYKGKKTPESWLEAFYMLEDLLMEKYKDNEFLAR
jgi:AAA+ ATPase superfamily predicted ATPase